MIDGFFQGAQQGAVALSASYENASEYWAGEESIDFGRNMIHAGLFGVYGLIDGLDVVGSVPFVNLKPQDASLYFKARLLDISIGKTRITLGSALGFSAPMTNYNTESSNAIGQQARAFDGRVFAQAHFNSKLFLQLQYGNAQVLEPVPSFQVFSTKIGYTAAKWYADIWFEMRDAETGKDYRGVGERKADNFRQLEVDYQRFGASFYTAFDELYGVSLALSHSFDGRNSFNSTITSLSLVRRL